MLPQLKPSSWFTILQDIKMSNDTEQPEEKEEQVDVGFNLDVSMFTDLADEAVAITSTSRLYDALNKVFGTLIDLVAERKFQRKQIVELLIKSGMSDKEIDITKLNAYWSSKQTKERIAEYHAQVEERKIKKQQAE